MYTEGLPNKLTMQDLLEHKEGKEYIRQRIEIFTKDGYEIINKNIPEDLLTTNK